MGFSICNMCVHLHTHTNKAFLICTVQVCLLFFFPKSISCCQQQPGRGKHILSYPCWDWISILHCSTMPLSPSGEPPGPWKKMWNQRESQKPARDIWFQLIMEGVFLFALVLSSGVKEFCILKGSVFVLLLFIIVCVCVWVYSYTCQSHDWGHLELRGAPTVCSCHMESSTSTRCWHENKRSPSRQGGLDNPSTLKTVCLFRLLDKHLFCLGVWRQGKTPQVVLRESNCSYIPCMTRFVLKAKCINSPFGAREQSLLWIILIGLQEPSGKTVRNGGTGLFSLSFNPERQDVWAAVWESARLHQGVVWRRRLEAGSREGRRQVTLVCHAPGTAVGNET